MDIWPPPQTRIYSGFSVQHVTTHNVDDVLECFVTVWGKRHLLHKHFSVEDLKIYYKNYCKRFIGNPISFVAVEDGTGKVVGFLLQEDFLDRLEISRKKKKEIRKLSYERQIMFQLFYETEEDFILCYPNIRRGQVSAGPVGVLPGYGGKNVYQALGYQCNTALTRLGYSYLFAVETHPITQLALLRNVQSGNAEVVQIKRLDDFCYDGKLTYLKSLKKPTSVITGLWKNLGSKKHNSNNDLEASDTYKPLTEDELSKELDVCQHKSKL